MKKILAKIKMKIKKSHPEYEIISGGIQSVSFRFNKKVEERMSNEDTKKG